ncbi:MAG: helix-turn-helix domain-containing protein [Clostridia bacterium]|nr:helix-turn-helix domain-containing protein [Clostridia bacterium]
MLKSYVDYLSQNGIYYHHTIQNSDDHVKVKTESHRRIEILFLISGNVEYVIDGLTFSLAPGDLIVVNAQKLHTINVDPTTNYERIVLQFDPSFIPSLNNVDLSYPFQNSHLYQHIIPKALVEKSNVEKLLRSILPLSRSTDKFKDSRIIAKIIDIISEINYIVETLISSEYHLIPQPSSTNEILQSIIKYINENITKKFSTVDISSMLGISESYLYRFFKQKMSITLHHYIQNQKLQYALSLLNQGLLPQYVSNYLGYDYYTTFYTQFKRRFNRPPKSMVNKAGVPRIDKLPAPDNEE